MLHKTPILTMVLLSFQDRDGVRELYQNVIKASCTSQACSVAILVAHEVDAMASCRILTTLLKRDNITYSLRPVANYSQVHDCLCEIAMSDIKTIFFINCGAVYNIPKEMKEANSDIRCIVMDNHRPFHLANIHNPNVWVLENEDSMNSEFGDIPSDGADLDTVAGTDVDDEVLIN